MSTMYNGIMRTMKASYVIDEGDITVIRPAIYAREKALRDFSSRRGITRHQRKLPGVFRGAKGEKSH